MKYMAIVKQKGEGCDYTIECGLDVLELNSTDEISALTELKDLVREEYRGDRELEDITLLAVGRQVQINVDTWYLHFNLEDSSKKAEQKESEERALYEKLKRKYGG